MKVSCVLTQSLVAGLTIAAALTAAHAQTASVADVASYLGPDRQARLLEGAKKEGGLTLYSSATTEDMNEHIKAFETKYPGVKIKFWRGDSEGILRRAVTETRGGRNDFDIVETSGGTMEAGFRENLFQVVKSPVLDDISPKAKFAGGAWTGTRFQLHVTAYNTNATRKEDLPKSYADFLDPRFKGKLGIELDDSEWFAALAGWMGEDKALPLWREIVAKNGVSVRKGHTLIANLTASGEVPIALGIYKYKVEQFKRKGVPIDWIAIPPYVVHPIGIALSQKAPHPNAAMLFFDFMLTDGQKIYVTQDTHPTNIKVMAEPDSAIYIDYAHALDEGDKWHKIFKEIFTTRAR
jgi:iron(III) transport system substrate-binding protein